MLKIIVLRSNYICLSSLTASLRLKRKLYDICYSMDNPLKYAFIAYKYRCCARHSADEFILAIRYLYLCCEHVACCRLLGCMRYGCYHTISNSVCFCIVTLKLNVCRHSSCYRIHIFIWNGYCTLMGICYLHLCADGFGIRYKICACQQSQYHKGDDCDTITDNP